jgi:hypothetical protein
MSKKRRSRLIRGSLEAYLRNQAKDYAFDKIKEAREKKKKKNFK